MVKVSVIVPIYNAEKYLRQCLKTILGQTLREIEVILIDDGSTDNSYKICQEFKDQDNRVRLYKQENKGGGAARNWGIQLAIGEYLSFLDSDDFFELNMLKTLYKRAKKTDADIVLCDCWEFDNISKQNRKINNILKKDLIPKKQLFSAKDFPDTIFQFVSTGAAWLFLYKRSFVTENNIKFGAYFRAEDIIFTRSALVLANKIAIVNKRLLHYRVGKPYSLSSQANKFQFVVFDVWQNFFDFLIRKKLYQIYKKSFLDVMAGSCLNYEIYKLKYPIRFLSEAYFVDKIIPKFHLNTLPKEYFYRSWIWKGIQKCMRSNNRTSELRKFYQESPDKIIPIVLATNEKMENNCWLTIQSIAEHASNNRFYDIYVLYTDLSEDMKYKLENMTAKNIHITTISVQKYIQDEEFPLNFNHPNIKQNPYYHCLISFLFSYKKMLWLDSNLTVQSDVAKLYDVESGNYLIQNDINQDDLFQKYFLQHEKRVTILDKKTKQDLKAIFIKKSFQYLFSFGERKKMYARELNLITKKIKEG